MDKILEIAETRQAIQYLKVASFVVFLHDYLVTLELEVTHIWKSNWSTIKVAFLVARYLPFVDVPLILTYSLYSGLTFRDCYIVTSAASWSSLVGVGAAEVILLLRTYALWDRSKQLLIFLVLLFIGVFVVGGVSTEIFLRSIQYAPLPFPFMRGCFPIAASKLLYVDFVVALVDETVIMLLTLYVGFKRYRHSRSRLVTVLYRDGVLYFMCLFMITFSYAVVLIASPPEYIDLLNTPHRVLHSILGARIVLQVREIAQKDRTTSAIIHRRGDTMS
ncbi:hypothetical protein BDZ94DRAFT_302624 [Collybia nuda]|uniref:DUF6533 domain-containing protein n=1 Tax=Collybia nuda TaxID=64659 RepID=A0A9P5YBM4_9AGAR|nr:hypothetical protein BDZ94DRAFT_302624 [Collybia nuda]